MKSALSIITYFLIFSLNIIIGQAPPIVWQNTISGNHSDYLFSIQQTSDGGYILGGISDSEVSGDKIESSEGANDYWVVKLDGTGQTIEWQNTIGGNNIDNLFSVRQTMDGGYILGGDSDSEISGDKTESSEGVNDYWIVKLDGTGAIEWQNTIGGSGQEHLGAIQQTMDGGYIIGGDSDSEISGDKTESSEGLNDYWIVKLDGTGVIEWQNTIGGSSYDYLASIKQTTDGGYILVGYSASGITGDKTEVSNGANDYWVVKLDDTGQTIVWQNTIGGNDDDELYSIQQTLDGGYILGGYSASSASGDKTEATDQFFSDYWVVKLNTAGAIEWQNTISGSTYETLTSVQQTMDGGYILGGYSDSGISGDKTEVSQGEFDYWVIKLDETGQTIKWQNTIGGSGRDMLQSISQTIDGGYILGGYSSSGVSGDKTEANQGWSDYWVVKLDADYNLEIEQTQFSSVPERFTVLPAYPNPFNPSTTISYGIENDSRVTIQIYDLSGRIISILQDNDQTQGWHSVIWNGTNQHGEQAPAGVYFSRITSDSEVKTSKLMLLK